MKAYKYQLSTSFLFLNLNRPYWTLIFYKQSRGRKVNSNNFRSQFKSKSKNVQFKFATTIKMMNNMNSLNGSSAEGITLIILSIGN